jgi:hypothetical protein
MAKKAKAKAKKAAVHHALAAHPATIAMVARVTSCNKPPILFRKQSNGTWMECFLKADCTYGDCVEVPASQVPAKLK